jgi:hypothetical protein
VKELDDRGYGVEDVVYDPSAAFKDLIAGMICEPMFSVS